MAGRRLSPDEQHLWDRLSRTVEPLRPRRRGGDAVDLAQALGMAPPASAPGGMAVVSPVPPASVMPRLPRRPADYLDNSWERRMARGQVQPDMSIDLHGHSLDAAHRQLDTALSAAVHKGARVLLVVTGKARPQDQGASVPGQRARGAIRAEIGHWLAISPHADAIASVRTAHPRHGGGGALYIILRRRG